MTIYLKDAPNFKIVQHQWLIAYWIDTKILLGLTTLKNKITLSLNHHLLNSTFNNTSMTGQPLEIFNHNYLTQCSNKNTNPNLTLILYSINQHSMNFLLQKFLKLLTNFLITKHVGHQASAMKCSNMLEHHFLIQLQLFLIAVLYLAKSQTNRKKKGFFLFSKNLSL